MTSLASTNPSRNFAVIDVVEITPPSDIPEIIVQAKQAQKLWKKIPLGERVATLSVLFDLFESKSEALAQMISMEMGMPIRQARDEVVYGLTYFRWYLENAETYLAPEVTRETESELHTVFYEPKGVVVAIAPWNYPFSMMVWTCIQPLLAGNSVIFKTSKECVLTGKLIAEIVTSSPLPPAVWTEVFGGGDIGDVLLSGDIDFVTFTGSTGVGQNIAKNALAKGIGSVMELGGSAPGIVLEDADIDSVLETIYFMRFSNAGQMCDGLKRLIVHRSCYDEVLAKLSAMLSSKKIGDAQDEATDIGPLVSEAQQKHLREQEHTFLESGATIFAKLEVPKNLEGAYFSPMILTDINRDAPVWREEVFGPILPVVAFDTLEEAIKIANDTPYGLGAYVFTESRESFAKIASELETGMVQMNNLNYCIPESPFGGYKVSGIGREHGKWGFHEFCNVKVTSIPK